MTSETVTRSGAGALAGLKVIDLSRVLGGPYATQLLGDHGAEIIKIEPPAGDETRDWGPPFRDGESAYFTGVNRSKKALALDIAKPAGRDVLLRLLDGADVLIENFKAGSLEKWDLGYEQVLRGRFPRLVHCSLTGFGAHGPFGGFPGYDLMVQAWTGMVSMNGTPDGDPMRLGIPIVDMGTGLFAVIGILMALRERDRTGHGQHVDVSLFDTGLAFQHPHGANWLMSDREPTRTGNDHPSISPYGLHRAGDGALFIGAGNDRQFRTLCDVLGCPDLVADPRFAANRDRVLNRAPLKAALEAAMRHHEAKALAVALMRQGVPAGAVLSVGEALSQPQALHRQMQVAMGDYRGIGLPVKLSDTPGEPRCPPPRFNQDGAAILAAAGFSEDEIAALARDGVLVTERRRL